MKLIQLNADKSFLLRKNVSALLVGLKKPDIGFTLTVYSEDLFHIMISITGRKGTITKEIIFVKENSFWYGYSENQKFSLAGLNDIVTLCKRKINTAQSLINKF